MTKSNKIRLYYGIFLAVLTVAVGVAFIAAAAQVYYGGTAVNPDYPYELDRIRQHILIPFILLMCWIAAIIGGIVVAVIFPYDKAPKFVDNAHTLALLNTRVPDVGNDAYVEAKRQYRQNEIARKCTWGAVLAVCLASAVAIFVYAFGITNYHANDLHGDILNLVKNVLSWTLAALVCTIVGVIVDDIMLKRQIAAVKTMIVEGDRTTVPQKKEITRKTVIASTVVASIVVALAVVAYVLAPILAKASLNAKQSGVYALVFVAAAVVAACFAGYSVVKNYVPAKAHKILLWTTRAAIGVVAIVFIVVGIVNGGANDVLIKAINICTECIGLG